jgi:hypothetical protein
MRQIESTPYDAFAVGDIDVRPPRGASNVLLRYGDLTSGNAPYSRRPGSPARKPASRQPSLGVTQALNVFLKHYLVRLATNGAPRGPIRFGVRTALGYERTHTAPSASSGLPLLDQPRIVTSNCAPLHAGTVTSEVTCPTRPRHPQALTRSTRGAQSSPAPRPSTNHSGGTAPRCSTKNPITPQHPQVTARTKRLANPGCCLPDGVMLQPQLPDQRPAGVTSWVTWFTPGGGTRTVSVSDLMVRW